MKKVGFIVALVLITLFFVPGRRGSVSEYDTSPPTPIPNATVDVECRVGKPIEGTIKLMDLEYTTNSEGRYGIPLFATLLCLYLDVRVSKDGYVYPAGEPNAHYLVKKENERVATIRVLSQSVGGL